MKFNSIQQRWNNREFLDSYVVRGFKEYEMLDYFVREYKLGITFSMGLLIGISRHIQTNTRKKFMEGDFKIKDLVSSGFSFKRDITNLLAVSLFLAAIRSFLIK